MKVKSTFLDIPGNKSCSNRLYEPFYRIGSKLELETSWKENWARSAPWNDTSSSEVTFPGLLR